MTVGLRIPVAPDKVRRADWNNHINFHGGETTLPRQGNTTTYEIYATDTSIYAKSSPGSSCSDYGDDISVTALTIQKALDEMYAAGGGVLAFEPRSILTLEDALYFPGNTRIRGNKATLKVKNGANLYCTIQAAYDSNIHMTDLEVDGNKANQTEGDGFGFVIRQGNNITVRRCKIHDCFGDAFWLYDNVGTSKVAIEENIIEDNGGNGVVVADNATELSIHGNHIHRNNVGLASWGGIIVVADTTKWVNISDNWIFDTYGDGGDSYNNAGIGVRSGASNVKIFGNQIYNTIGQGILVFDAANPIISHNICKNSFHSGLYLDGNLGTIIRNNVCSENIDHGIVIGSYGPFISDRTTCEGNICEGNGINGIINDSKYVQIIGNLVRNNWQIATDIPQKMSGILSYGWYSTVAYNTVIDDQVTKTQKYGISNCLSGGNWGRYQTIGPNICVGNELGAYYIFAPYEDVREEVQGTGSIPGGWSATSVVVTHGLGLVPKVVMVTPINNVEGRSFWVTDITLTTFTINISSTFGASLSFHYRAVGGMTET